MFYNISKTDRSKGQIRWKAETQSHGSKAEKLWQPGYRSYLIAFGIACPKVFFVLKFFRSICGLVIKKYMGGGDKKKANI